MAYDNLNPFGKRKPWDVEQEVDFPPINLGRQIGPLLGAELFSLPGIMGSPSEAEFPAYSTLRQPSATADVSGVAEGSAPQATETEPTTVGPQSSRPSMPWGVEVPGQLGEQPLSGVVSLPITERGNQQFTMTVPAELGGGSAEWTKAMPEATAKWLEAKRNEQNAQREAGMRLAENQAKNQALAERVRANEERFKQIEQANVLRDLHYRDPKAAATLFQQARLADAAAKQKAAQADEAGTPESQAFRRIVETQGLPAALAWLKDFQTSKATSGRQFMTPEMIAAREAAKVSANYGATAQNLKGATARAMGEGRAVGQNIGEMQPIPGAPGQPGVSTVQAAKTRAQAENAPIPAGEREPMAQFKNLMTVTHDLLSNFETDQDYYGPVRGRVAVLAERYGLFGGLSPREAHVRAAVGDMNNRLLYMLSGKQINEQEYARLKATLPDINLPAATALPRLQRFAYNLQEIYDERTRLQTRPASQVSGPTTAPTPAREEVRYDKQGRAWVRRNGQVVPYEGGR